MAIDDSFLDLDNPDSGTIKSLGKRKRKKRKLRPWQSDEVPVGHDSSDESKTSYSGDDNINSSPEASEASLSNDTESPANDMQVLNSGDPDGSRPFVPSTDRVQTEYINQEQELGTKKISSKETNREQELGTNRKPSRPIIKNTPLNNCNDNLSEKITPCPVEMQEFKREAELGTKTGYANQEQVPSTNQVQTRTLPELDQSSTEPLVTNRVQTKSYHQEQTGYMNQEQELGTSRETIHDYSLTRNENSNLEQDFKLEDTLLSLKGNSKLVFSFLVKSIGEASQSHVVISSMYISHITGIKRETLRTTLKRLREKGLIEYVALSAGGKGAKRKYSIPSHIMALFSKLLINGSVRPPEIQSSQPGTNWVQNLGTKLDTNTGYSVSSKLEEKNLNSTLTSSNPYEDYESIDLSSVESLGITQKQIRDIRNQKLGLTKSQLEDFVEKFSQYANDSSQKIYRPAGLFVKMAQELARGEDPLPHLDSGSDMELKSIKQRLLAEKAKREKLKAEIQDLLFDQWWDETSKEKKSELVPEGYAKGDIYRMSVRAKWIEEIWPETDEAHAMTK